MRKAKPKPPIFIRDKEQLPTAPGYCGSCVKLKKIHDLKYECAVLHEVIGKDNECWAWSGDPGWWERTERIIQEYNGKWCRKKWKERKKRK